MSLEAVNNLIDAGFPDNNNRQGSAQKLRDTLKLVTGFAQEAIDVSEEAIDLFNEINDPARNAATQAAASAAAASALVLGQSTNRPNLRPNFYLDLTTEILDPRVTYTRNDALKTYFDSKGLMRVAKVNEWPVEYDPFSGKCLGRSVWEGSVNLAIFNQDLTNAWYQKSRCVISPNAIIDPMGLLNADLMTCDITATGGMYLTSSTMTNAGTVATYSGFIYKGNKSHSSIAIADGGILNGVRQWYNLTNSTLGSSNTFGTGYVKTNATIRGIGNNWYYVTLSATVPAVNIRFVTAPSVSGDLQFACDIGDTASVWGEQLELKPYATPTILTNGVAGIRNEDQPRITGTNFSEWYRQDEGTFFVSTFSPILAGSVRRAVAVTDGTTNNSLQVAIYGNNQAYFEGKYLGGIALNSPIAPTIAVGAELMQVLAYKKDDFLGVANGLAVTDSAGDIPVVNQLNIGHYTTFGHINAPIKQFAYWARRIGNSEAIGTTTSGLLAGKNPNQFPTMGDLRSGATTDVSTILASRNRQEIPVEGTGVSRTITLRRPYEFRYAVVDATGVTITAQPSTSANLAADTNHTITFNAPAGTFLTVSVTPVFTI